MLVENGIRREIVNGCITTYSSCHSEAYQKALEALSGGADRDVRLFEGI